MTSSAIICKPRYNLNRNAFECIKSHFEEAYGLFLKRDLCAEKNNSYLPVFGFPRHSLQLEDAIVVHASPLDSSVVIEYLQVTKIVYLIIIPEWRHHLWHSLIQSKASHRFVFSVDEEMCGAPKAFYPFAGYVIDSRFNTRPNDLITVYLPSPSHSSRLFFPPRQILPRHDGNFIKNRPKPHLNAQWFLEWGRELPPKLLSEVVTGITTGFPTQYRGGGRRFCT